jgi:hypothetical protein
MVSTFQLTRSARLSLAHQKVTKVTKVWLGFRGFLSYGLGADALDFVNTILIVSVPGLPPVSARPSFFVTFVNFCSTPFRVTADWNRIFKQKVAKAAKGSVRF